MDMNADDISQDELPTILREKNPDIVGIGSACVTFVPNSLRVARIAKGVNPRIITIGEGINLTLIGKEVVEKNPTLDFVVRGEGKITILKLIEAFEGEWVEKEQKSNAKKLEGRQYVIKEMTVFDLNDFCKYRGTMNKGRRSI